MALPVGLLVKGLLGTSAVTTAAVSIVFKEEIGEEISNLFISKDRLNEKIKGLGITETTCLFEDNLEPKTCTLNADKFQKITFVKGGVDATATSETISVELKIEKLNYRGYSKNFPSALRFTLKNTQSTDLDIGTDPNKITLKKNIDYDFKIKTEDDKLKLEKAWTLKSLAKKVGLSCAEDTATECSLTNNGTINVWKANDDYITGAKGDTSKMMTVTKESSGYFEGLKFTVKDSSDITLEGGTKKKETDGIDKLTQSNKSYEIDLKDDNGTKKWFLVEKSTSGQ